MQRHTEVDVGWVRAIQPDGWNLTHMKAHALTFQWHYAIVTFAAPGRSVTQDRWSYKCKNNQGRVSAIFLAIRQINGQRI